MKRSKGKGPADGSKPPKKGGATNGNVTPKDPVEVRGKGSVEANASSTMFCTSLSRTRIYLNNLVASLTNVALRFFLSSLSMARAGLLSSAATGRRRTGVVCGADQRLRSADHSSALFPGIPQRTLQRGELEEDWRSWEGRMFACTTLVVGLHFSRHCCDMLGVLVLYR